MYWAQVKDALDQGLFDLSPQRKSQSDISLQDELRITAFNKTPVENSDEKLDRKTAMSMCKQATNPVTPEWKPQSGRQPRLGTSQRLALPPLPSNKTENSEERSTAPAVQRKLSGHQAQRGCCPTLSSSMAVTMQTALLPLGSSLHNQGSCFEIIRIRTEERATVSRHGGVLPPITRGKNKI